MSTNPLYTQLIERVMEERPDLAPFAQMFQQMQEDKPVVSPAPEMSIRLRKLTAAAKAMEAELDDALDDLDELADALGACDKCWGRNNRCECCRGEGGPGYFKPNRELFDRLILPAVLKANWLQQK